MIDNVQEIRDNKNKIPLYGAKASVMVVILGTSIAPSLKRESNSESEGITLL